jgi:hypothetical protein
MSASLVWPTHPVHAGIGPKYRSALARIRELEAEVAQLRAQGPAAGAGPVAAAAQDPAPAKSPPTGKPVTLVVFATVVRGPRSKLTVSLDQGPDGSRYIAFRWWMLAAQGAWIANRGVSLKPAEVAVCRDGLTKASAYLSGEQESAR